MFRHVCERLSPLCSNPEWLFIFPRRLFMPNSEHVRRSSSFLSWKTKSSDRFPRVHCEFEPRSTRDSFFLFSSVEIWNWRRKWSMNKYTQIKIFIIVRFYRKIKLKNNYALWIRCVNKVNVSNIKKKCPFKRRYLKWK